MRNKQHQVLALLFLLSIFHPMSLDMYTPAFPEMMKDLNGSITDLQFSVTIFIGGLFIFQLLYGLVADYFGRKFALLSGISIYIVFSLLISVSQGVESLWLYRFFQAAGAGAGATLGIALVTDYFDKSMISIIRARIATVVSFFLLFSPVLGSYFVHYLNWRIIFIFQSTLGAIALVLMLISIKKTIKKSYNFSDLIAKFPKITFDKSFSSYAIPVSFQTAGMYSFITTASSIFILHYGVSVTTYGWFYAIAIFGYMTGNLLIKRLKSVTSDHKIFIIGMLIAIISSLLLFIFTFVTAKYSYLGIIFCMYWYMFSSGLIFPSGTSLALKNHLKYSGIASAILVSLKMLVAMLVTAVLALIGSNSPFYFGMILISISLISFLYHISMKKGVA